MKNPDKFRDIWMLLDSDGVLSQLESPRYTKYKLCKSDGDEQLIQRPHNRLAWWAIGEYHVTAKSWFLNHCNMSYPLSIPFWDDPRKKTSYRLLSNNCSSCVSPGCGAVVGVCVLWWVRGGRTLLPVLRQLFTFCLTPLIIQQLCDLKTEI